MSDTLIKSVNHAIDIMEFLYLAGQESSISDISAGTGLFGSTVHRQLSTLKERGFVDQNPENAKYWLTHKFYEVVSTENGSKDVVNTLYQGVDRIAKKYGQLVYVAIPDYSSEGYAHYVVKYSKSYRASRVENSKDGMILMAHTDIAGRCLMAFFPDTLLEKYSQRVLPNTGNSGMTGWEQLRSELRTIKDQGFGLETEAASGKVSIAVPVLGANSSVIASVCISGSSDLLMDNSIRSIIEDLKAVSSIVSSDT